MRFALIDAEKAEFPVRTMCRLLDVSESGFFAWQGRPASQRQRDDMIYLAHIRTAFELSNRTYGSPRVNGGAKLVHPGGAKLVHLMLCGTRCWGVVPVVHRRDPRCFV